MNEREVSVDIQLGENENSRIERIVVKIKNVSNSRSFKIRLTDKNTAILTKPKYASIKESLEFLNSCKSWLAKQILATRKKISLAEFLQNSPKIYHLDTEISVEIIISRTSPFMLADTQNKKLVLAPTQENFATDLEKLFLKFATKSLAELADVNSKETGLSFTKVSVRDQSSRWASRSSSGTLSLNWRIILLEPQYQTYIIRHELAHTKFMDHSVSFWIFLNRICSNAQRLDKEIEVKAKEIFNIQLT